MKTFAVVCAVFCMPLLLAAQSIRTLMPPPKTAFEYKEFAPFAVTQQAVIVLPDTTSPGIDRAAEYLRQEIKKRLGITLATRKLRSYVLSVPAVLPPAFVFLPSDNGFAPIFKERLLNRIEAVSSERGSYIADIRPKEGVLMFNDDDGALNAVLTIVQLLNASAKTMVSCHIWDAPDYPVRWVFSQHNLLVYQNITQLAAIADTMATYKLNGLQQNDYKYNILERMTPNYFANTDTLKRICTERNINIIPGVCGIGWSDGILQHDPNLAEGVEARTTYVIVADTGRLLPDAAVVLPEGGFENVNGQGKFPTWGFYDDSFSQDKTVFHSGTASAHAQDIRKANSSGNARFSRTVNCTPHGYYVMSAWAKTANLQGGYFQLLAIGKDAQGVQRPLTFTALDVPATTSGWQKIEVIFNTLESTSVILYCGVWDADSGEFWLDDFTVQPAGLTNILRRTGTPLHVRNKTTGGEYSENKDFAPVIDPLVEQKKGAFGQYHTPPTFRRLTNGTLRNGDTVVISYFHPFTAVSDNQGNGSVMVCVSEDSLYSILGDQITRVNNLYHPDNFFLSHDEIRNMNRDSACLHKNLSPAALLAENVVKCDSIVGLFAPDSRRFIWSDMFDSLHNAVNNYYLINGDMSGIWNTIPQSLTIVNWNSGKRQQSMEFFARHGFRQITSPYYDAGNSSTIRGWRLAQQNIPNLDGMMYTTWAADYSQLRAFGYYAWGAGPYIMHRPMDSTVFGKTNVSVEADIAADPFDNTDNIVSAILTIHKSSISQVERRFIMQQGVVPGLWAANVFPPDAEWFRYSIEATNRQGITRRTPQYEVWRSAPSGVEEMTAPVGLTIAPNPAEDVITLRFIAPAAGAWSVAIHDVVGRTHSIFTGSEPYSREVLLHIPTEGLTVGTYRAVISANGQQDAMIFVKQ